MDRAYSALHIKQIEERGDFVFLKGLASSPSLDREGDILNPMGAIFKTPMPLLWQHKSDKPVGHVTFAKPTKTGIPFEAQIPIIKEAGLLKDRLDEVIQSLRHRLVGFVSVGFTAVKDAIKRLDGGGLQYDEWSWLELSLVTIPAQPDAVISSVKALTDGEDPPALTNALIQTVKALDQAQQNAGGGDTSARVVHLSKPGVSGPHSKPAQSGHFSVPKGNIMGTKTIAEQLSEFALKRTTAIERMDAIMAKAGEEGRSLDTTEAEEYDGLEADVKSIESHLVRLKAHQTNMVDKATKVTSDVGTSETKSVEIRGGGQSVISVRRNLEQGIPFTRYAMVLAQAKGNLMQAEVLAQRFEQSSPEVLLAIKAAVAAGTTQDATWAAPLVQLQEMQSEFVSFLRPLTLLGRFGAGNIPNLRRVPFNIKFTRQTAGTTGTFVGEGLPKPLGKMDFELLSLTWAKAATIIVMTQELVRFSNPAAEALARDDLAAGISLYLDRRFIDPSFAGVANVSPASITNGIVAIASSGVTIAAIDLDVQRMVQSFITANSNNLGGLVWIMNPRTALSLSKKRNTDGTKAYPDVNATGGSFEGYPVLTSNNVSLTGSPTDTFVVLLDPSEVMVADDDGVSIDMSTEASLQMSDTPSGGATSLVSLWQSDLVALRAERFINWRLRRAAAVSVLSDVNW